MTCKDCVHYEACCEYATYKEIYDVSIFCSNFKNKSLFVEIPLKIGGAVDKLFSHNETIALWYDKPDDKEHSYLLWKGMAWSLPDKFKNLRIIKFKGIIPEKFSEADTLNIQVTPYIVPKEVAEQA